MVKQFPGNRITNEETLFFLPITYSYLEDFMYVDSNMIDKARTADLYKFLKTNHLDLFRKEGISIRLIGANSVSIRQGYYGYSNFSTGETGNGIDFLMNYLGYSFQEAVKALAENEEYTAYKANEKPVVPINCGKIKLPDRAPLPHSRMFAFLFKRGLSKDIIAELSSRGLIYQSAGNNNVVFVNKERDYCELRGTYTYTEKPFHGCIKNRPDRFWYFMENESRPNRAYVTEAAIDAISLYLIHKNSGEYTSSAVYVSVGGASNHKAIKRIKNGIRTILAVDNDKAGQLCRDHHRGLEYILPNL